MRKHKQILTLALALALCLGLFPTAALAATATVTQVIPYEYDVVMDFKCGLAAVANGKVGAFEDVYYFGGEYAIIDTTGKEVVPFGKYQSPHLTSGNCHVASSYLPAFSEGYAAVYLRNKGWGFIDTAGKEVIPCQHREVKPFSDGLAAVQMKSGDGWCWGFIDTAGREVIPCQYNSVEPFSDGLAVVKGSTGRVENGRTVYGDGVIDKTGKVVVPFGQYKSISSYHDGLAEVRKDGGYHLTYYGSVDSHGFIDTAGREVIPCQYEEVEPFSEGLAAVETNSGWGFIDKTGKLVIPCQYEEVEPFSEGLAAVKTNSGWGYIDLHGNEVIPCQHGEARQLSEGMLAVDLDGKWGFVRVEGLPTEPKAVQTVTDTVTPDKAADNTAYASTQTVMVDGKPVEFECYALKDENGDPTNYIKLRDLAMILNGTAAQFQVGWDGSVMITTKTAYTPNGSELSTPYSGDQIYAASAAKIIINGKETDLAAFTLDNGGFTYFQLRELGQNLGFNVGWSRASGVFVETDKPYDSND